MTRKPIKGPTKTIATRTRTTGKAKVATKPVAKPESKQAIVLAMLRRQDGASIAEIIAATGWQAHSVRGFFAGALKKRLGIDVISEKGEDGVRRYYIAPLAL